jgi:hypothetical protein
VGGSKAALPFYVTVSGQPCADYLSQRRPGRETGPWRVASAAALVCTRPTILPYSGHSVRENPTNIAGAGTKVAGQGDEGRRLFTFAPFGSARPSYGRVDLRNSRKDQLLPHAAKRG